MKIYDHAPILDAILEGSKTSLGDDFAAYRNHCYRVLNFTLALSGTSEEYFHKVSISAAFHDLGIWVNHTYDYLAPSKQLVRIYLAETKLSEWGDEIEAIIEQHHKLTKYKAHPEWLVESFRKADWIDVSRGSFKFGLSSDFVSDVMTKFPNKGFHRRLVALTKQRVMTYPLSPLPMMRL